MPKPKRNIQDLHPVPGETPDPTGSAQPASGDSAAVELDRDRVAQRAYELYLSRGGHDGQALDDWLVAERELRQPRGSQRDDQES